MQNRDAYGSLLATHHLAIKLFRVCPDHSYVVHRLPTVMAGLNPATYEVAAAPALGV